MLNFEKVVKRFPEARESWGKNGREYVVHCPQRHVKGGVYKLYINAAEGVFKCMDCGYEGNAYVDFFDPAQEMFADWDVPREGCRVVEAPKINPNKKLWAPGIYAPGETVLLSQLDEDHPAIQYLSGRGFDMQELLSYKDGRELYYCTKGQFNFPKPLYQGTTTGRIVFKFYMGGRRAPNGEWMLGELKGWQARRIERCLWMSDDESSGEKEVWNGFAWKKVKRTNGIWEDRDIPKYYNCPGIQRSEILVGFDHAVSCGYREIAVAEGPLDYYRTGPQCIGTIGESITEDQIRVIKSNFDKVFFLVDPEVDMNGPKFQKTMSLLRPLKVYALKLKDEKGIERDPGSTPRESTWAQIAEEITRKKTVSVGLN